MKKLILILLALSLTVGLFVGCSPSDEPADGDNELNLPNEQLPDEDADGTNDQEAPDNTPTDEEPDDTNDQEAPDDTSVETPDAPIEREISNKDIEALYYNEIAPKQIKIETSSIEYADVGDTGSDGCWYFEEIYSPLYFCRFELLDKFIEFNNVPDATLRQKIGAVEALKIPSIYRFIRDMNIDIETFKAINERNKLRVEQNPNFELGTCIYTDEEIETIYYGTYNEVLEAVKHPLAVVIGNNIYSYNELFLLAQQNKLADVGIAREDFVEHIEKANAKRMDYYIESCYYFTADKLESAAAQLKTRAELGIVTPPPAVTE